MRGRPQKANGLRDHSGRNNKAAGVRKFRAVTDGDGRRMRSNSAGAFSGRSSLHQPFREAVFVPHQEAKSDTLSELRKEIRSVEAALRQLESRLSHVESESPDEHLKAAVDTKQCVACGMCEAVCPAGAITLDATAHIDPLRCLGCGDCVSACPRGAISLYFQPEAAKA